MEAVSASFLAEDFALHFHVTGCNVYLPDILPTPPLKAFFLPDWAVEDTARLSTFSFKM